MSAKDFKNRSLLRIFVSYFRPHLKLFTLDMLCALGIALVDLLFPLISRTAMYEWLPEKEFGVFFVAMAAVMDVTPAPPGAQLEAVRAAWQYRIGGDADA